MACGARRLPPATAPGHRCRLGRRGDAADDARAADLRVPGRGDGRGRPGRNAPRSRAWPPPRRRIGERPVGGGRPSRRSSAVPDGRVVRAAAQGPADRRRVPPPRCRRRRTLDGRAPRPALGGGSADGRRDRDRRDVAAAVADRGRAGPPAPRDGDAPGRHVRLGGGGRGRLRDARRLQRRGHRADGRRPRPRREPPDRVAQRRPSGRPGGVRCRPRRRQPRRILRPRVPTGRPRRRHPRRQGPGVGDAARQRRVPDRGARPGGHRRARAAACARRRPGPRAGSSRGGLKASSRTAATRPS